MNSIPAGYGMGRGPEQSGNDPAAWFRRRGNELDVARRVYRNDHGRQIWVDAAPGIAPGATLREVLRDARRLAEGRLLMVVADEVRCSPEDDELTEGLATVQSAIRRNGWSDIYSYMASHLDPGELLMPAAGTGRLVTTSSLAAFQRQTVDWVVGLRRDSGIASTPLIDSSEKLLAPNVAQHLLDRMDSVGAVVTTPWRAGDVHAALKSAGFRTVAGQWGTVVGHWQV